MLSVYTSCSVGLIDFQFPYKKCLQPVETWKVDMNNPNHYGKHIINRSKGPWLP